MKTLNIEKIEQQNIEALKRLESKYYKVPFGLFDTYEDYQKTLEIVYNKSEYIVNFRSIYQVHYSINAGYYYSQVYYRNKCQGVPLTSKKYGATTMTANEINNMLGFNLLNN